VVEGLHELRGVGECEAGVAAPQAARLPQDRRHYRARDERADEIHRHAQPLVG
jgi:hypothetical protein